MGGFTVAGVEQTMADSEPASRPPRAEGSLPSRCARRFPDGPHTDNARAHPRRRGGRRVIVLAAAVGLLASIAVPTAGYTCPGSYDCPGNPQRLRDEAAARRPPPPQMCFVGWDSTEYDAMLSRLLLKPRAPGNETGIPLRNPRRPSCRASKAPSSCLVCTAR